MISVQELLYNRGIDKNAKIKLVRHKDSKIDLYNLYKTDRNTFLKYQSQQGKEIFKGVEYIVTFIGEKGTLARLIGIYKVLNVEKLPQSQISVKGDSYRFFYEFEYMDWCKDLMERVIIDWGKGAINWHQWIENEKEVIEIHPGLHYKQFTDYDDVLLDFTDLKEIVKSEYKDWKDMLSATKGIYLISDTKTGKLYVGSAYGENGIWGRWKVYVSTNGHGNNKTLKELVSEDSNYAQNFRFSILMLLPKTVTPNRAIEKEQLYKRKLGTNSFGLNNN